MVQKNSNTSEGFPLLGSHLLCPNMITHTGKHIEAHTSTHKPKPKHKHTHSRMKRLQNLYLQSRWFLKKMFTRFNYSNINLNYFLLFPYPAHLFSRFITIYHNLTLFITIYHNLSLVIICHLDHLLSLSSFHPLGHSQHSLWGRKCSRIILATISVF